MAKKKDICKFWTEDGHDEICKASYDVCTCGADAWYCDYPRKRRDKLEKKE